MSINSSIEFVLENDLLKANNRDVVLNNICYKVGAKKMCLSVTKNFQKGALQHLYFFLKLKQAQINEEDLSEEFILLEGDIAHSFADNLSRTRQINGGSKWIKNLYLRGQGYNSNEIETDELLCSQILPSVHLSQTSGKFNVLVNPQHVNAHLLPKQITIRTKNRSKGYTDIQIGKLISIVEQSLDRMKPVKKGLHAEINEILEKTKDEKSLRNQLLSFSNSLKNTTHLEARIEAALSFYRNFLTNANEGSSNTCIYITDLADFQIWETPQTKLYLFEQVVNYVQTHSDHDKIIRFNPSKFIKSIFDKSFNNLSSIMSTPIPLPGFLSEMEIPEQKNNQLEIVRLLIWSEDELISPTGRWLVPMHHKASLPCFFLSRELWKKMNCLHYEYVIMCEKDRKTTKGGNGQVLKWTNGHLAPQETAEKNGLTDFREIMASDYILPAYEYQQYLLKGGKS